MKTPPRKLPAPMWLVPLAALLLVIACGGGDDDDDNGGSGLLSDPQNVPTATPWQDLPEVIVLDPENIQPLPTDNPGPGGGATGTPAAGEPGVCGATYTVEAGDTTFGIADKCGVDPDDIIAANPEIDPRSLSVGQVLVMPAESEEQPGASPEQ